MDNQFEFTCRVCLVDSLPDMRPLADKRTRELLFECTNVLVEPEDKYPQQMCTNWWSRCQNWSEFKELAQESDRRLRLRKEQEVMDHCDIEIVKSEMLDDEEITIVKEEPVEFEGYSLAYDYEGEEEDDPNCDAHVKLEDQQIEKELTPREPTNLRKKNFKCGYCSKAFPNLSEVNRHELIHSNERPFQCDTCERSFKRKESLKRHIFLLHTGVKELECSQCDKKFISRANLVQHMVTHTKVKAYECDQCHKKFAHNTTLHSHKKSHLQTRPYKCGSCAFTFKHKRNLDRHLKNIH